MKTTTNRSPTKATKPNPEPALVECPVCLGTGKIAPDAITFGMRLRAGRLHRKMTQDDLARELRYYVAAATTPRRLILSSYGPPKLTSLPEV